MVRQKIVHCGKGTRTYYREVDIIVGKSIPRQRGKKRKRSLPKQERLNFKNSVRHLHQLFKGNFTGYDYRVDLTYDDCWLPDSLEAGRRYVDSYIRKVNSMRKKKGLASAKRYSPTDSYKRFSSHRVASSKHPILIWRHLPLYIIRRYG